MAAATCLVCGLPQRGHAPCAICQSTNAHTRICAACKKDPVNLDENGRLIWGETWEELGGSDDVAADQVRPTTVLAEVIDKRIRNATERQRRILELGIIGERISYQYRYRGRSKGRRWRFKALSLREIAERVGVHWTYVQKVLRQQGLG